MLNKLRSWFNKDSDELTEESRTMTPSEKRDLTDYEDQKTDHGGGGYAREPHTDFERDSEPPRY
jgi:hypothetical protein